MLKRTFSVQATTAMFMHGAGGSSGAAELRPPSIKGVLRYWFRAVAGAYFEPAELRKCEAEVFGDTDSGAKLIVRVVEKTVSYPNQKPFLLPHKAQPNQKSPSNAVAPNSRFDIVLQSYPGAEKGFEAACWSLWVAINLGGFGQRARRGAGSLKLEKVEPSIQNMPVWRAYQHIGNLADDLQSGLTQVCTTIAQLGNKGYNDLRKLNEIENFPILAPDCAKIQVIELSANNEQKARSELMEVLHKIEYKGPAFGLPFSVGQDPKRYVKMADRDKTDRHASPLHLHITQLPNNYYALVQTLMYSKFEPAVWFESSRNTPTRKIDEVNWGIEVLKLKNYLQSFDDKEEVKL